MPNVIVTGATGINGRAIIKKLCEQPETWGTVYAVSRSSTEEYPSHVKHITTDFLNPGANIAEKLKGVQGVEYIFYAAYRQELNDQGNWDTNVKMLQNFLEALQISGIQTSSLKRIVITLGAKWYGVQFGPVRNPCVEDDPRVEAPFPPNFYYGQVDVLKSAAKGQQWDWVAALPSAVQGFAKGNAMNFASSLALYAAITKELGEELIFPGSQESYFGWDSLSYAPLVAEFEIWAALNPACGNQLLNIENGDPFTWSSNWTRLARQFGCKVPANHFSKPAAESPLHQKIIIGPGPLMRQAEEAGMKDASPSGAMENQISLAKWAERTAVKEVWETMSKRDGLDPTALGNIAQWVFADFCLGRNYECILSMRKARKLGWTGYIDTWDAYLAVFEELARGKIIPNGV